MRMLLKEVKRSLFGLNRVGEPKSEESKVKSEETESETRGKGGSNGDASRRRVCTPSLVQREPLVHCIAFRYNMQD